MILGGNHERFAIVRISGSRVREGLHFEDVGGGEPIDRGGQEGNAGEVAGAIPIFDPGRRGRLYLGLGDEMKIRKEYS